VEKLKEKEIRKLVLKKMKNKKIQMESQQKRKNIRKIRYGRT